MVEDEPSVARGLEYGLTAEGFTVLVATDGASALEIARGGGNSASPHLMLLDVRLPDMSGFDVCRVLREEGRAFPILMVTARDEEVDKVLGLELGADDDIVKPFPVPRAPFPRACGPPTRVWRARFGCRCRALRFR